MRFILSSLSVLATAGLAFAGPLSKRAVTAQQFQQFTLLEQYAAAAYCPANDAAAVGSKLDCNTGNCPLVDAANTTILLSIDSTPLTDTAGFVAADHTNKLIVAAFRGSESIRNYATDLNIEFIPYTTCSGCIGAAGFWTAWAEVSNEVVAAVQAAQRTYPSYRAQSAGHSLGGAIATIAAAELRNAGIVTDMTTFGSPQTGNEAFVQYMMAQDPQQGVNYRVTHIYDPVPSLPGVVLGYRHISPSYFITAVGMSPVTPADIQVQVGTDVVNPWGPTPADQTTAHGYYMGMPVSICYPQDQPIQFKKRALTNGDVSPATVFG